MKFSKTEENMKETCGRKAINIFKTSFQLINSRGGGLPPSQGGLPVVLVDNAFHLKVGDAGEEGDGLPHRHVAISEEPKLAFAVDVLRLGLHHRFPNRIGGNLNRNFTR